MEMSDFWRGRRVLITGHTGFKGGWLATWLEQLGAEVHGIAKLPETDPSLFEILQLKDRIHSRILDIDDADALASAVGGINPEVIFHLAAQPLVRRSHEEPLLTFRTNVMGTAHLLEAARALEELQAVICVTTDKVYKNQEWAWPYRETDTLGGKDPYSASKAAAELVVEAYQRSFYAETNVALLTARGGNVIGGGDWSEDRLVPDLFRAIAAGQPLEIRAPEAVRPWQHVLVLCHGYLEMAQKAISQEIPKEGAWNFGPSAGDCVSVGSLLELFAAAGASFDVQVVPDESSRESRLLTLDSSRARTDLGWSPALDLAEAVRWTAEWYGAVHDRSDILALTLAHINSYTDRLETKA